MATMLLVLLSLTAAVQCRSDKLESLNQVQNHLFKVCIDDSDCSGLEGKYACFQYICYPYENDNLVLEENKKTKCTRKEDCQPNEVCHRHHDRRNINVGLCMEELGDCRENGDRDCPDRCCNGQFCCEEKYFNHLKSLPCVNHDMCKDLGYGDFCCPVKGSNTTSSVCCNTNPNPPPTRPPPKVGPLSGSSTILPAMSLLTLILSAFFW
ncbi:uncharacterized protein LOC111717396 isoform X2 [Eurytemora carolleeae]|uniref:uncharacterized protein LOC111717396 isoform X2 n=1 Tax=Eurytemora carolleeae TaxID=1294199 RepID=UPI000C76A305|nr:uncharacterized protein LOC111717396 isoform X2 [Eurytemora carolleeae]|eukprot:XP_023348663.1 uncharacterized protein LOC111717396 isoform X2 [Eurytemora affinis]